MNNPRSLALAVLLLLKHGSCYPDPYKQSNGPLAVRDGIEADLEGLTGTTFQVLNYQPVCGTLATSMSKSVDLSGKCTAAMAAFNTSTSPAAIYDISGVLTTALPGSSGMETCICGALGTASATAGDPNANGLLCLYVNQGGTTEVWWSFQTDDATAMAFQLSARGDSLPHCNQVNLASLSSASFATRTAEPAPSATGSNSAAGATTAASLAGSTAGSTAGPTAGSNADNNNGQKSSSGGGLSKQTRNIIIIVVVVVLVLAVLTIGVFLLWRRSRRTKERLQGAQEPKQFAYLPTVRGTTVVGDDSTVIGDGRTSPTSIAQWSSRVRPGAPDHN